MHSHKYAAEKVCTSSSTEQTQKQSAVQMNTKGGVGWGARIAQTENRTNDRRDSIQNWDHFSSRDVLVRQADN